MQSRIIKSINNNSFVMQPYFDPIGKKTSIFLKMEDNLNFFEKGRRPQFLRKCKTTSKKIIQPKTIKSQNNGCGTAPSNLVNIYKLPTQRIHK